MESTVYIVKSKGLIGKKQKERTIRRQCVIPFPSEAIESTLITAQIDNLLLIKELTAQSQLQKH